MQYTGYHGTTKNNKKMILKNGFKVNKNTWPNDLGFGVYNFIDTKKFYTEAKTAAIIYAKKYRPKEEAVCVINNISVEDKSVLDLNDEKNLTNILRYRSTLTSFIQTTANQYREKHPDKSIVRRGNTDGFFLEKVLKMLKIEPNVILIDRWEDIDSVKFKTVGGQLPNCTVLVVRNIESIEKSS